MTETEREQERIIQDAARKIAEYAAKRPKVCDFIGDVQKFAFEQIATTLRALTKP